eukprot:5874214-Lingulodinium_polyedra.AAC.1
MLFPNPGRLTHNVFARLEIAPEFSLLCERHLPSLGFPKTVLRAQSGVVNATCDSLLQQSRRAAK